MDGGVTGFALGPEGGRRVRSSPPEKSGHRTDAPRLFGGLGAALRGHAERRTGVWVVTLGWVVRIDPLRPTLQPEGGYSFGRRGRGQGRPPPKFLVLGSGHVALRG